MKTIDESNRALLAQLGMKGANNYLYCRIAPKRWYQALFSNQREPRSLLVVTADSLTVISRRRGQAPQTTTWSRAETADFSLAAGFYEDLLTFKVAGQCWGAWIDVQGRWDGGVTSANLAALKANGFFERLPRRASAGADSL